MSHSPDPPGKVNPSELISLAQAAKFSGLSATHLRSLCGQGKLWGIKIGRNWVTTKEAVRAHLATDPRPGPKPRRKT